MKIVLISVLVIVLVVGIILVIRDYYVMWKLKKLTRKKHKIIEPLLHQLASNGSINDMELMAIAADPSMRIVLFRTLEGFNSAHLFPQQYYNEEKGAEGYLVNWLEFPTELGKAPDEIMLLTIVELKLSEAVHYYVFKYRASAPRWAAKYNWMLGVCGPYNERSMPFDIPRKVFSRFKQAGTTQPASEVHWVHENINN